MEEVPLLFIKNSPTTDKLVLAGIGGAVLTIVVGITCWLLYNAFNMALGMGGPPPPPPAAASPAENPAPAPDAPSGESPAPASDAPSGDRAHIASAVASRIKSPSLGYSAPPTTIISKGNAKRTFVDRDFEHQWKVGLPKQSRPPNGSIPLGNFGTLVPLNAFSSTPYPATSSRGHVERDEYFRQRVFMSQPPTTSAYQGMPRRNSVPDNVMYEHIMQRNRELWEDINGNMQVNEWSWNNSSSSRYDTYE